MAIETRRPQYSPHTPTARQYPLSEKQAAWFPRLQAETLTLLRSAAALEIDAIMLAEGKHADTTRKDAARVVETFRATMVAGVMDLDPATMTSGEFSMLVGIRDGARASEAKYRDIVARKLSRRAGRPVTGAQTAPVATTAATAEDGATYRAPDGRVFHAYLGQSGRLLAKLWTPNGEHDDEGRELGDFVYFGAANRLPSGIVRMTTEDAQVFGRATGTCCICMRHLENDESVKRGIGPVCAGKVGL